MSSAPLPLKAVGDCVTHWSDIGVMAAHQLGALTVRDIKSPPDPWPAWPVDSVRVSSDTTNQSSWVSLSSLLYAHPTTLQQQQDNLSVLEYQIGGMQSVVFVQHRAVREGRTRLERADQDRTAYINRPDPTTGRMPVPRPVASLHHVVWPSVGDRLVIYNSSDPGLQRQTAITGTVADYVDHYTMDDNSDDDDDDDDDVAGDHDDDQVIQFVPDDATYAGSLCGPYLYLQPTTLAQLSNNISVIRDGIREQLEAVGRRETQLAALIELAESLRWSMAHGRLTASTKTSARLTAASGVLEDNSDPSAPTPSLEGLPSNLLRHIVGLTGDVSALGRLRQVNQRFNQQLTSYHEITNRIGLDDVERANLLRAFRVVDGPDVDGTTRTYLAGQLHSFDDQPSINRPGHLQVWHQHGKKHRDHDMPSFVLTINPRRVHQEWCQHGKRHRDGGRPAITDSNGDREWWVDNRRHRDNDQPAVVDAYGRYQWWRHGVKYRRPAGVIVDTDAGGDDVDAAAAAAKRAKTSAQAVN